MHLQLGEMVPVILRRILSPRQYLAGTLSLQATVEGRRFTLTREKGIRQSPGWFPYRNCPARSERPFGSFLICCLPSSNAKQIIRPPSRLWPRHELPTKNSVRLLRPYHFSRWCCSSTILTV